VPRVILPKCLSLSEPVLSGLSPLCESFVSVFESEHSVLALHIAVLSLFGHEPVKDNAGSVLDSRRLVLSFVCLGHCHLQAAYPKPQCPNLIHIQPDIAGYQFRS
jgi:hypothetical protein